MGSRVDQGGKSGSIDLVDNEGIAHSVRFGGAGEFGASKAEITLELGTSAPNQLGIRAPDFAQGELKLLDGRPTIDTGGVDLQFYTRAGDTLRHTEFQFDALLKTREAARQAATFVLEVPGYQNFDFDRIEPFKEIYREVKRGQPWVYNYERGLLLQGEHSHFGIGRQAWHQGGYEVRHKDWTNHRRNRLYCHISRPRLTDANGQESWGEVNFDAGHLVYTFDRLFLETAELPIRLDPTFGDTTAGGDTFPWSGDRSLIATFTLTEAATLSLISVYSGGGTLDFQKGIIYTATAATTFTSRQAVSAAQVNAALPAWHDMATTGALAAGNFGVGSVADGGVADEWYKEASGGNDSCMANGTLSYASPPASHPGNDATYGGNVNAYATYTAGGGAAASYPFARRLPMGIQLQL